MTERGSEMTDDERMLWMAVCGASFASSHRRLRDVDDGMPPEHRRSIYSFDNALAVMSIEESATLADAAVRMLRQWRSDEDAKVGVAISTGDEK